MMRAILTILLLVSPSFVHAKDVTCTIPTAWEARATQLCEVLRKNERTRNANWSDDLCATELLRLSLRRFEDGITATAEENKKRSAVRTKLRAFDRDYPLKHTKASCGDLTIDTEFGEQCDPPNGTTCK